MFTNADQFLRQHRTAHRAVYAARQAGFRRLAQTEEYFILSRRIGGGLEQTVQCFGLHAVAVTLPYESAAAGIPAITVLGNGVTEARSLMGATEAVIYALIDTWHA